MATTVKLRRSDTSHTWGFKMQGGRDVGMPLFVAHVSPNGIASLAGLKAGDGINRIGAVDVTKFTHEEARAEIIRSGNDIDFIIERGVINVPATEDAFLEEQPRMSVSEHDADTPFQEVQSKSYKMLEGELTQTATTGARPSSIFDKNKGKRSAYTQAEKSGYLKAMGQP